MNEMKTKRIISVIAAASAVAALLSCNKEESVQAVQPSADGEIVFTASLPACEPASKVSFDVDATNKVVDVLWHENDIIYLSDGTLDLTTASAALLDVATNAAPTAHACSITLTSDMISADGKTVTFTVPSGVLNTSATKWYAFATNNPNAIYRFLKNGTISTREFAGSSHLGNGNMKIPYMAAASCTPDNLSLSFKHALCYLHYTCNAGSTAHGFAFAGNDESDTEIWGISINASGVASKGSAKTPKFFNSVIGDTGTEGYIALAPGVTFAKGFTITAIKDDAGTANDAPLSVTTHKSFTTVAGKYYELGKLNDIAVYDNYYDLWNAGKDITVDGVVYNKATYTSTPVHVTSNTTISTESGIYFVDPSATLTVTGHQPNRIIIGNSMTERSKLALNSHFFISGKNYILLKNLDITLSHSNNAMFCLNAEGEATFSIDDCYIDNTAQNKPLVNFNVANANPVKLSVINSDVQFKAETLQGALAYLENKGQNFSVTVMNSVIYMSTNVGKESVLVRGGASSVLNDLTFDHNTIMNFSKSGWRHLNTEGTVKSITVTNNYFYTDLATCYWNYFYAPAEPASCTFSGNYSTGLANGAATMWGTVKTEVSAKVADQFVALDIDNRNFKLKVSEYGAQR